MEDDMLCGWDYGEEGTITAAARASGFVSNNGKAWVYEAFGYNEDEQSIQTEIICVATYDCDWMHYGNGLHVPYETLHDVETGLWKVEFGTLEVFSHNKRYTIKLEKQDLVNNYHLSPDAKRPTPESVVFKLCDALPREALFSDDEYLARILHMGANARRLFTVENWEHPDMQDLYDETNREEFDMRSVPDVVSMVRALCEEDEQLVLNGTPNMDWHLRWQEA